MGREAGALREERECTAAPFPAWASELTGWIVALLLALLAVGHMAATDRSWMLYYDSETVLPALVRGSVLAGQPQDWALSAVLFIPEMGVYWAVAALGFGVKGTFILNAVVNFLLLYGSLRLLSGLVRPERPRSRRIVGALVAFAATVFLTFLENSSRWDSFEVVSLLATGTFYGTTVLASVLSTGLAAPLAVPRASPRRRAVLEVALLVIIAVATLTNPLILAWEAVPLAFVFALLARRRITSWKLAGRLGAVLTIGAVFGLIARIPFASLITKDGPAYAKPSAAMGAGLYFLKQFSDLASTPAGTVEMGFVVALILSAVIVFRSSTRDGDVRTAVLAGMAWAAPLVVVVGMVALGGVGTRYFQPIFFAPLCLLVLVPELLAQRTLGVHWRRARVLVASIAGVCLVGSGLVALTLRDSAEALNPDIGCVDAWITSSQRTGAGRFWTIRGPKAYLRDPGQLIQVDKSFGAYQWLTNRTDYATKNVSFVLSDTEYPAPALPVGVENDPRQTIRCGRYTITDFVSPVLVIGPASTNPVP